MKIGILTFHCAHNYGAVLQCYALQETLKSMGHDVEVIDYRPEYLLVPYQKFDIHRFLSKNPIRLIKNCCKEVLLMNRRRKRYKAFDDFISSRLNLSEHVQGNNIPPKYDIYVMGSDQIWNTNITHGFDDVYFGNYMFLKGNKKYIAYAASMGNSLWNDEAKSFYLKSLENFDSLSVRESSMKILLQPLIGKKIEEVLDPTLLADSCIWKNIIKKPYIKYKYVLVYQVRSDKNTLRIARQIANEIGAVVIEVMANFFIKDCFHKNKIQCASPEEFIGFIKNASFIVTTSFHGTAFSIIFNKPFYCVTLNDGEDSRSASLLKSIGLENRMIQKDSSPKFSDVDFNYANESLSLQKKESLYFLNKAIRQ